MLTAQRLGFRWPFVAGLLLLAMPKVFALTFSGLTEPLFALVLIAAVYWVVRKKATAAALLLSFLPFVRSEGLIMMGVFGLYFLWEKQWRVLPFLLLGHVAYGLVGYALVFDSPLWVFDKIPYARLNSIYGQGDLFRFIEGLLHITGLPVYLLFGLGSLWSIVQFFRKQASSEWVFLVFLLFWTFLVAHSLFWYLGIFNSMGLLRVLVGVAPLAALLAVFGWEAIAEHWLRAAPTWAKGLQVLLLLYVLVFPFTSNIYALWPERDLALSPQQQQARVFVQQIQEQYLKEDEPLPRIVSRDPYLSLLLEIDHLDYNSHMSLNKKRLQELQPGDWILWDSWFAVIEEGIKEEDLDARGDLQTLYRKDTLINDKTIVYKLYRRK